MMFTDAQIETFQQLYLRRFGREISKEDAYDQAVKLVSMLKAIYKPMELEEYEATQKRRLEMLPKIACRITSQDTGDMVQ